MFYRGRVWVHLSVSVCLCLCVSSVPRAHISEAEKRQARTCVCVRARADIEDGALELSEWQACSRQREVCERLQVCGSLGKGLLLVGTVISAHWLGAKLGNQRNSWKRL